MILNFQSLSNVNKKIDEKKQALLKWLYPLFSSNNPYISWRPNMYDMLSLVCCGFQIWYIEFEMARNHGWSWLEYKWFTSAPWSEVRCNVWPCGRVKLRAHQPQFILLRSSWLLLPSPRQRLLPLLAMRRFAQWHAKALRSSCFSCSLFFTWVIRTELRWVQSCAWLCSTLSHSSLAVGLWVSRFRGQCQQEGGSRCEDLRACGEGRKEKGRVWLVWEQISSAAVTGPFPMASAMMFADGESSMRKSTMVH